MAACSWDAARAEP
jgi:hypothetical protein